MADEKLVSPLFMKDVIFQLIILIQWTIDKSRERLKAKQTISESYH